MAKALVKLSSSLWYCEVHINEATMRYTERKLAQVGERQDSLDEGTVLVIPQGTSPGPMGAQRWKTLRIRSQGFAVQNGSGEG